MLGPRPRRQTVLRRQMPDHFPCLPVRESEIVLCLQVQPELRINAKPVAEPQRGVTSDGTLAGNNLADAVRWHIDLAREFSERNPQSVKFVHQTLTRMFNTLEYGVFCSVSMILNNVSPTGCSALPRCGGGVP